MLGLLYRLIVLNLLGNLLRALGNLFRLTRARSRPLWVLVDVREPLPARPPKPVFWRRTGPSLARLNDLLGELGKDRRLAGVIIRLGPLAGGWARVDSLRDSLARLRSQGMKVLVHLSSPGIREYSVACAADSITADDSGPLSLTGLAAEVTFWGEALARAGIGVQEEHRGEYKSFAETFAGSQMSPPHREALDAILDGLQARLTEQVARARRLEPALATERITGGPYTAREAHRLGLVDAVSYVDELPAFLSVPARRVGTVAEWRARRLRPLRWRPLLGTGRRVMVLSLHGSIVDGEGAGGPRPAVGDEAAARALDQAARKRSVAAVVLHVDSRGGSASASDQIWRHVLKLVEKKPVVAYLDDVAASGGYYLSCAATRIVAQPGTLTGSIGVVAGKPETSGLRERLGFKTVLLARGAAAGMNSTARPYTDEQRKRLVAEVDALYHQFVDRVTQGRRRPFEEIERAARGRVWLGSDALARGLVDELGDVDRAIELARGLARRRPGERLAAMDAHLAPRHQGLLAAVLGMLVTGWLDEHSPELAELAELERWSSERVLALGPRVRWL